MMRDPATAAKNIFSPPQPVREMTNDEIDVRAFFDESSPTFNFRYLVRSLHRELVRCQRYNRPLSLLVVTVDRLAAIGMEYGMLAVDNTIKTISEAIVMSCRADVDMVGRYQEDRFMVLLPETPVSGAVVLAERLRKKCESLSITHQWHQIKLGISVGIAHSPAHGSDIESLIAQADVAADIAQERGGNSICCAPEGEKA